MESQRIKPYTLSSRSKNQSHEPNFCDKREQSELVQTLPNRAKISEAKLVKEYTFANAKNRTKK
jgi:hypothetical protein